MKRDKNGIPIPQTYHGYYRKNLMLEFNFLKHENTIERWLILISFHGKSDQF